MNNKQIVSNNVYDNVFYIVIHTNSWNIIHYNIEVNLRNNVSKIVDTNPWYYVNDYVLNNVLNILYTNIKDNIAIRMKHALKQSINNKLKKSVLNSLTSY